MGHRYRVFTYFEPNTCNTICDVTGFKVKRSQVRERWEGYYVIPPAYAPRQPQDFQVTPIPQRTFPEARFEDECDVPIPPPFERPL